ncbi:MAG: SDR family NAD(P)-dependent oxidoreductase [Opitutae bacterium]|nr:SDR family NAD(P)-dependent oxidoreductase [Opitutae bacterium]
MTNDSEFSNRVAVVTGGTGGIGRALTLALAGRGCRVWFCGRNDDREETEKACGGLVRFVRCDLSRPGEPERFVAEVLDAEGRIDYLVNTARSQIFSTGLPPVSAHWLCFVLRQIPLMREQRVKVDQLASRFRAALRDLGLRTDGSSNIVPVMVGDAARTVAAADRICEAGYWVKAVRPPTVPVGTSRLRLSLNAAMSWEQLAPLPAIIKASLE